MTPPLRLSSGGGLRLRREIETYPSPWDPASLTTPRGARREILAALRKARADHPVEHRELTPEELAESEAISARNRKMLNLSPFSGDLARMPSIELTQPVPLTTNKPKLDERAERWRIPTAAFWLVLEQRVKRGKAVSVHSLVEETRRHPKVPFLGKTRVTKLVDWIDAHPEQAQHALDRHETPAGFRATSRGVLVPRR